MKTYKITVGGRGADCYIHKLNVEQNELLTEGCVDEGDMSMDEILEVLKKDYITDTDDMIMGVYEGGENHKVIVYDDNENVVWESDNETEFTVLRGDSQIVFDEPNTLIAEDILKGEFFNYKLELEEDFDPKKLTVNLRHVGDIVTIITGFRYDEKLLEVDEYGDYWDKGYNFYMV